jgi:hypothetical protein
MTLAGSGVGFDVVNRPTNCSATPYGPNAGWVNWCPDPRASTFDGKRLNVASDTARGLFRAQMLEKVPVEYGQFVSYLGTPDDGGRGQAIWEALRREAGLTAEHLGLGATAIGRANYERTATYAQALFALSIGFERAAKLVLTLAAVLDNGAFLDGTALRKYGHRLDRLLGDVERVASTHGIECVRPDDSIHRAILAVLTDFASNVTRYYNLELLSSPSDGAQDPIAAWHTTVAIPVLETHYASRQRTRDDTRADALAIPASTFISVIATGETGEPIRDLGDVVRRGLRAAAGKPWERMYVLQIARYVTNIIGELGSRAQEKGLPVPYLEEYFYTFQMGDREFRQRKVWTLDT